jgi:hypothetical protein
MKIVISSDLLLDKLLQTGPQIIISESLSIADLKPYDLGPGILKTTKRMIDVIVKRLKDGKVYSFGPVPSGRAFQFSVKKFDNYTGVSRILSMLVGKIVYFKPFKV